MKRGYISGLAVIATSATMSVAATVTFHSNPAYRVGDGGEFQVRVVSGNAGKTGMFSDVGLPGASSSSFQTFCLERNENMDTNVQVQVTKGTGAVFGGINGGPNDLLSNETAYLYSNFRRGTLQTTYEYTNLATDTQGLDRRRGSARALQLAFWVLEEEYDALGANTFNAAWAHNVIDTNTSIQSAANYTADQRQMAKDLITEAFNAAWSSIGNVRVLNWTRDNGQPGQSVLTLIPLPSAGGLALAGLLVVGTRRRRNV